MKTTVYSAPDEIKAPEFKIPFNSKKYESDTEEYLQKMKAYVKNISDDPLAGEVINFPVADGNASYMVISLKPSKLVHLELMDAWEFRYITSLTSSDIQQKIKEQKALKNLFS